MIIYKKNSLLRQKYKIQKGNVAYTDLDKPGSVLFSRKYRLVGKPDYIIKKKNLFIPVEIKTGNHSNPQKNHIFQLAAYCHLIEENYGTFVPYGILVYNNQSEYKISYNPKLRFEFESIVKEIKSQMNKKIVRRNHNEIKKCVNCSMKQFCKLKLTD